MTRRTAHVAAAFAALFATAAPAAAARLSCPGGTTAFASPMLTVETGLHGLAVTVGLGENALSYLKIGDIKGERSLVTIPAVVFGGSPQCKVIVGGDALPMAVVVQAMAEATTLIDATVAPRAVTGVWLDRPGSQTGLAGQEGEDFVMPGMLAAAELAGQEGEDIVMSGTLPEADQIVITDTSAGFWLGGTRGLTISLYPL